MAQTKKFEYSYIITQKSENIYARNVKTDSDPNTVSMNYTPPSGETLKGEGHTHQDDISNGPANKRCSLDIGDVVALMLNGNSSRQDFVSLVEMGDIRQAIVIEDPAKAAVFVRNLNQRDYLKAWVNLCMQSPYYLTDYRLATLNATLSQLGSSTTSGIGFYKTIDAAKVQFTKLN